MWHPHGTTWLSSALISHGERKKLSLVCEGEGACGCVDVCVGSVPKKMCEKMQGSETQVFHADQRLH